jgi:hypothetical protein
MIPSPIIIPKPEPRSQGHGARAKEPGPRSQGQGARGREPGPGSQGQGARAREPGPWSQGQGARAKEPGSHIQRKRRSCLQIAPTEIECACGKKLFYVTNITLKRERKWKRDRQTGRQDPSKPFS